MRMITLKIATLMLCWKVLFIKIVHFHIISVMLNLIFRRIMAISFYNTRVKWLYHSCGYHLYIIDVSSWVYVTSVYIFCHIQNV